MNLDNLNNLTPEQVNQIKENGGFSGSASAGITFGNDAQSFEPQVSIPISGYATQVRPRMSTHGTNIITGPSAKLPKKLARQADEELKQRQAAAKQAREDPLCAHNLRKDLEAMRRQIKRLEKQLEEQKNA